MAAPRFNEKTRTLRERSLGTDSAHKVVIQTFKTLAGEDFTVAIKRPSTLDYNFWHATSANATSMNKELQQAKRLAFPPEIYPDLVIACALEPDTLQPIYTPEDREVIAESPEPMFTGIADLFILMLIGQEIPALVANFKNLATSEPKSTE